MSSPSATVTNLDVAETEFDPGPNAPCRCADVLDALRAEVRALRGPRISEYRQALWPVFSHVLHAYDEAEELSEVVGSPHQPGAAVLRQTLQQTIGAAFDAEPFRPGIGDPFDPVMHHDCAGSSIDPPQITESRKRTPATIAQVLDSGFRTRDGAILRRCSVVVCR